MSRLLFAAARGARVQLKFNGGWEEDRCVMVFDLQQPMWDYRIHPSDAHLQYGPISTELRNEALEDGASARWICADAFVAEYLTGYDIDVVQSFPDTRMFLLILAEALADEGL